MFRFSTLLRLLLCVALVFNGATSAMASVQMAHGGMAGATEAVSQPAMADGQTTTESMTCHDQQATTAATEHVATAPTSMLHNVKHQSSDCCKSGVCRCTCVHHVQAAVPAMAFYASWFGHTDGVHSMPLGHAAPALPNLIRPPIG